MKKLDLTNAKIGEKITINDDVYLDDSSCLLTANDTPEVVGFYTYTEDDSEYLTIYNGEVFGGGEEIICVGYLVKTYNISTGERGVDAKVYLNYTNNKNAPYYIALEGEDKLDARDLLKFIKKHNPDAKLLRKIVSAGRRKKIIRKLKKRQARQAEKQAAQVTPAVALAGAL